VPPVSTDFAAHLKNGHPALAEQELERGPPLAIFSRRDHGGLLAIAGVARKAIQYEIGNPLTASRMTRLHLPAALYAPLRVVLYENRAGRATFEYDKPSTLFGQFGDEDVTAVARGLDAALFEVLARVACPKV
jgi:uncharacterized protein (DUF302 family)